MQNKGNGINRFSLWAFSVPTRLSDICDEVAEEVNEFHPTGGFEEYKSTPEVAVISSVTVLPVPNDDNVGVDEDRKEQQN